MCGGPHLTPDQETALVIRAQCGDREAMERLLHHVQRPLYGYVSRLVGATHADDVAQETLIAIARKLTWLAEPRVFRAWAFRIASRASFAHLRRRKRRPEHPLDEEAIAALEAPQESALSPPGERLRELLDSDRLTPASRAVLLLHFQEEMPLGEVAAVLEIPLGTVKSRLAFGLKTLRGEIKGGTDGR